MAKASLQLVTALRKTAARLAAGSSYPWGHLGLCRFPIDDIIGELVALGLTTREIGHLEKLDEPRVLAALSGGQRWLRRNDRADLVAYLETWADLLEAELPAASQAA